MKNSPILRRKDHLSVKTRNKNFFLIQTFCFCLYIVCFSISAQAAAKNNGIVTVDLTSPRAAMMTFVDACRASEYDKAVKAMDFSNHPELNQVQAAKRLKRVLDQHVWFDWAQIPNSPDGSTTSAEPTTEENQNTVKTESRQDPFLQLLQSYMESREKKAVSSVLVGEVPLKNRMVPVRVEKIKSGETPQWKISSQTVNAIEALNNEYGLGTMEGYIPDWSRESRYFEVELWQWLGMALFLLIGIFAGAALRAVMHRLDDKHPIIGQMGTPSAFLLGTLIFWAGSRGVLHLSVPAQGVLSDILMMVFTIFTTWLAIRSMHGVLLLIKRNQQKKDKDMNPARIRARETQMLLMRRILTITILVIGAGFALAQFDQFRALGTSLLASAGVATIAISLAAQRSLANLLAGIQIAVTQPIRVGDSVVVEGEWGWIEDITLTFVTIRIWDLRRLVLPINYFLDKPFQNWTIREPKLIGTVYVSADYRVDVERMRDALKDALEGSSHWNKDTPPVLQVTDWKDDVVEIRALCSAKDAGTAWDLRCEVREKLLNWLQEYEDGKYLPRSRMEFVEGRGNPLGGLSGPEKDVHRNPEKEKESES